MSKPKKSTKRDDDDDDDNDDEGGGRKSKKKKPAKNNTLLLALIGGGGVALLSCCILTGVLGYVFWPNKDGGGKVAGADKGGADKGGGDKGGGDKGGGDKGAAARNNPAVTKENMKKLTAGLTRKEVEEIMGPGESADVQTVNAFMRKGRPADDFTIVEPDVAAHPGASCLMWRNDPSFIVVAFVPLPKYGDVAAFIRMELFRDGKRSEGGTTANPVSTLELARKALEKKKK